MGNTRVRAAGRAEVPQRLKPRKSPAQARSRALVEAVVEAATRILVERGWEGLTMQRVAAKAGVSPGSLYQYFPDKAAVVAQILERQSERELAFHLARFAAVPPDAPLLLKLEVVLRSVLDFQREESALMRRTLASLEHVGRYAALRARAERAAEGLGALLYAHQAELGGLDVPLALHVLGNAIHSLTHDGVLPRPATLNDEVLLAQLLRLVRGYLGV